MDLAAAAAGARGTRMSLLRAGWSRLEHVGRSNPKLSGLNTHATTGSGPTRQSDTQDSEPLVLVSVAGARAGYFVALTTAALSYLRPTV